MTTVTYEEQRTDRQKREDAKILERVKRGLELLEKEHGPGWEDKINLETLNLQYGMQCVLGQVYAENAAAAPHRYTHGYDYACAELGGAEHSWDEDGSDWARKHGFYTSDIDGWEQLTETWKQVLTPRIEEVRS